MSRYLTPSKYDKMLSIIASMTDKELEEEIIKLKSMKIPIELKLSMMSREKRDRILKV